MRTPSCKAEQSIGEQLEERQALLGYCCGAAGLSGGSRPCRYTVCATASVTTPALRLLALAGCPPTPQPSRPPIKASVHVLGCKHATASLEVVCVHRCWPGAHPDQVFRPLPDCCFAAVVAALEGGTLGRDNTPCEQQAVCRVHGATTLAAPLAPSEPPQLHQFIHTCTVAAAVPTPHPV